MEKIIENANLQGLNQLIVVKVENINSANIKLLEKVDNMWKTLMEAQGYIGKNGLGKLQEGDMKTPTGEFELGIAFGTHINVQTKLEYYTLNENMYWIGDSNSKYYNRFVDKTKVKCDWDSSKNEHLIEEQVAYEYAIEIKYNEKCEPNKGSAIFLHCIKNGPTAGCVAIQTNKMKFILENIKKDTKIYIN